jgi:hypothetical protein
VSSAGVSGVKKNRLVGESPKRVFAKEIAKQMLSFWSITPTRAIQHHKCNANFYVNDVPLLWSSPIKKQ